MTGIAPLLPHRLWWRLDGRTDDGSHQQADDRTGCIARCVHSFAGSVTHRAGGIPGRRCVAGMPVPLPVQLPHRSRRPRRRPASAASSAPKQTEGPYYIDANLMRSDITEGREGRPLRLDLLVQRLPACQPIANALIEIWQCDALGEYSGFTAAQIQGQGEPPGSASGTPSAKPKPPGPPPGGPPPGGGPGGPPGGGRQEPANALRFLRGGQMTDAQGRVSFQTIYPGWYMGRTVHIHFKVRTDPVSATGYELTSQLYFDDALTDQVHATAPYSQHTGRDTRNSNDGIYRDGGAQLTIPVTRPARGTPRRSASGSRCPDGAFNLTLTRAGITTPLAGLLFG